MKYLALFLTALVWASPAFAQARPEDVKPFEAKVYVIRGKEFFDNWNKEDQPPVENAKNLKLGEDLYAVVFFTNVARDRQGVAKITFTMTIKAPDGKSYVQPNLSGAEGPLDAKLVNSAFLAASRVPAKLPTDGSFPAGKYVFTAVVKDNVAGTTSTTETTVQIDKP